MDDCPLFKASPLDAARWLLTNDEPLPVDLTARLLEVGVDVAALEARFG